MSRFVRRAHLPYARDSFFHRLASDSLGTSDSIAQVRISVRACADSLGSAYQTAVLSDNPKLYLRLNETVNSVVVEDSSGNGRTGNRRGGPDNQSGGILNSPGLLNDGTTAFYTSGIIGDPYGSPVGGEQFNRPGIDVPSYSPFVPNTARTFEGIYKADNTQRLAKTGWASQFWGDSNDHTHLMIGADASTNVVWPFFDASGFTTWTGAWPGDELAHHVLLTWDDASNTAELWIDGVSKGQKTITVQWDGTLGNFDVARPHNGDHTGWCGTSDEVAVYESVLSSTRIAAHVAAMTQATDVATRVLVYHRTAADTLGTTDVATRAALSRIRTGADSLGTSDSVTKVQSFIRTASDSLGMVSALDSFTDAANTQLQNHVGERANWTEHPAYSGAFLRISDANRVRNTSANALAVLNQFPSTTSIVDIQTDIHQISATATPPSPVWDFDSTLNQGYHARWEYNSGNGRIVFFRIDNGTFNTLATYTTGDVTDGTIRVVSANGKHYVLWNGVIVLSVTDSTYTSGLVGLRAPTNFVDNNTTGIHADNLVATSDVAIRAAFSPVRTASDTLGTTDVATRTTQSFTRTGADSLSTSDAASRATLVDVRTTRDYLGTTDERYFNSVLVDIPSLYYHLNEPSGLSAIDSSGNARNGTYDGNQVLNQTGLIDSTDKSVFLDASTINTGYNPFTSNSLRTFEFWYYRQISLGSSLDALVGSSQDEGPELFFANDGTYWTATRAYSADSAVIWPYILPTTPIHGVITYNDSSKQAELFINGESQGVRTVPSGYNLTGNLYIGSFGTAGYDATSGDVDEYAVYEAILDRGRILTHARAGQHSCGANRVVSFTRSASDSLGTTDTATRAVQAFTRTASDSLGTTDTATAVIAKFRTASDTLGTTDTATRSAQAFTRTTADSLDTTDSASRLDTYQRTAADTLGTTDSAEGTYTPGAIFRTASDTLGGFSQTILEEFNGTLSSWTQQVGTWQIANGTLEQTVNNNAPNIITRGSSVSAFRIIWRDASSGSGTIYKRGIGIYVDSTHTLCCVIGRWSAESSNSLNIIAIESGSFARRLSGPLAIGNQDAAYYRFTKLGNVVTMERFSGDVIANPNLSPAFTQSYTLTSGDETTYASGTPAAIAEGVYTPWTSFGETEYDRWALEEIISDTATRVLVSPRTGSDTLGTTDTATKVQTLSRVASDTLGTTDVAAAAQQQRTASDSLDTTDVATQVRVLSRSSSDSLSTTDSATRAVQLFTRTSVDTLGTTDSAARSVETFSRAAGDSLDTSDTATRASQVFIRTSTDTLGTSDSTTKIVVLSREATDTLGTSDSASKTDIFSRTSTDTLGTSDAANKISIFQRSTTDSLDTSDSAEGTYTPGTNFYSRTASDSLGTTDTASTLVILQSTASDTLDTSDVASSLKIFQRTGSDTLGTTDTAVRASFIVARSSSDSLNTSDVATRSFVWARSATDSLTTSDVATRSALVRSRSAEDTLGTSDTASRISLLPRSTADTLGTSDSATRGISVFLRVVSDSLGTTDVATKVGVFSRVSSDSLSITDSASREVSILLRTAVDSLNTVDSAQITTGIITRTADDSLLTSDVATRSALLRSRSSTDILGTSDSVVRIIIIPRSTSDVLGTTDSASRSSGLRVRITSDTLGTTDLATRTYTLLRSSTDLLGTTDSATISTFFFSRETVDTLGTSDSSTRGVQVFLRSASDTIPMSDLAALVGAQFSTSDDYLGTDDEAHSVIHIGVLATDTISVTDSCFGSVRLVRVTFDILATHDSIRIHLKGKIGAGRFLEHQKSGILHTDINPGHFSTEDTPGHLVLDE